MGLESRSISHSFFKKIIEPHSETICGAKCSSKQRAEVCKFKLNINLKTTQRQTSYSEAKTYYWSIRLILTNSNLSDIESWQESAA